MTSPQAARIPRRAGLEFEILGVPAPQGSKTRMPNGAVIEGGSKTGRAKQRAWRDAVSATAFDIARDLDGPLDGAVWLRVGFRLPMPASRPKWAQRLAEGPFGGLPHTVKPDLDKLLRSTLDGLTDGGLIRDDARVFSIEAEALEVVGWTGAVVAVGSVALREASS